MNLFWTSVILVLALVISGVVEASTMQPQGIYGSDDRKEVCEHEDVSLRMLAHGTLAMVQKTAVNVDDAGKFILNTKTYGEKQSLCKTESFWSQPTVADCSGFLIGEDLLVTAGHCVFKASCGKDLWVFNYQMKSDGSFEKTFEKEDVYKCQEILVREQSKTIDYAVIKLNRKVRGGVPVKMRTGPEPKVGDGMFVIGYPMGLPAKIAGNANLRKWGVQKRYFVANLDTYGGNSGSPVFNANTLEVEGILARGDVDFVNNGACKVSKKCTDGGCDGEEVTNITYVIESLRANLR